MSFSDFSLSLGIFICILSCELSGAAIVQDNIYRARVNFIANLSTISFSKRNGP